MHLFCLLLGGAVSRGITVVSSAALDIKGVQIAKPPFIPPIYIIGMTSSMKAPPTHVFRCFYESSIPELTITKGDSSSSVDFGFSSDLRGAEVIAATLYKKNFTSIISDTYSARYKVSLFNSSIPGQLSYESLGLDFLRNQKIVFKVMASQRTKELCPMNGSNVISVSPLLLTYAFLISIIVMFRKESSFVTSWTPPFWVSTREGPIPDYEGAPSEISKSVLAANHESTAKTGRTTFDISRMVRGRGFVRFERTASVLITPDIILDFVWLEEPSTPSSTTFKISFESDSIKLKSAPVLATATGISLRPYTIELTTTTNIKATLEIAGSILVPFQPIGLYMQDRIDFLLQIVKIIESSSSVYSNMALVYDAMISKLSPRAIITYDSEGRVVYSYLRDDIRNPYNHEAILGHLPAESGSGFVDSLATVDTATYCSVLREVHISVSCVIIIDSHPSQPPDIFTISTLMTCAICLYTLAYTQDQLNRLKNFFRLLANVQSFVYHESDADTGEEVFTGYHKPSALKSLNLLKEGKFISERQRIQAEADMNRLRTEDGVITNRVYELDSNGRPEFVAFDCMSSVDPRTGRRIISYLLRNVTEEMTMNDKLEQEMLEVSNAISVLDIHRFTVVDGEIILDNTALGTSLGRNTRSLLTLVALPDVSKLSLLREHNRILLQLQDRSGGTTWYSAMSNGNSGFLYNAQDLVEARNEAESAPEASRLSSQKSSVVIWAVDLENENVIPFFNYPTIWEVLGYQRTAPFSHFMSFLPTSFRPSITAAYKDIRDSNSDYWTKRIQVVGIGGRFVWHQLTFLHTSADRMICILVDISEHMSKEERITELNDNRNKIFETGGAMLWEFNDNYDDIPLKPFQPGARKIMQMNWKYVDHYIGAGFREEFVTQMKESLQTGKDFGIVTSILYSTPFLVLLQGKVQATASKIVGFCLHIDPRAAKSIEGIEPKNLNLT